MRIHPGGETMNNGDTSAEQTIDSDEELLDLEIIEDDEPMNQHVQSAGPRGDQRAPEKLAPLFEPENARDYRARWDVVQLGFVDDPAKAVRAGDELVSEVIDTLSTTFAQERTTLDADLSRHEDPVATELLRCALRRDRAFFERLLSF